MKKQEPIRNYRITDAELIVLAKEKAGFMQRDATAFAPFGITAAMTTALITSATAFSNFITDIEATADMTAATAAKNAKAEQLRVAIRGVMARVEQKYLAGTSRHNRFGTSGLSEKPDPELLIAAKTVVRTGTAYLTDLSATGLTATLLAGITTLSAELETLVLDLKMKIGDRDVLQEDRVEAGNVLYQTLVTYTNTGQTIWETSDVAKYNDYVLYNTPGGEAPKAD